MPHINLEYSENLETENNYEDMLIGMHWLLADTGLFKIEDFKSRAVKHKKFCVGDNSGERAFAACNVSILSGRDDQTKIMLSEKIIRYLADKINKPEGVYEVNITVQISELHKPSYKKITK